jgi:hypothetical protein
MLNEDSGASTVLDTDTGYGDTLPIAQLTAPCCRYPGSGAAGLPGWASAQSG